LHLTNAFGLIGEDLVVLKSRSSGKLTRERPRNVYPRWYQIRFSLVGTNSWEWFVETTGATTGAGTIVKRGEFYERKPINTLLYLFDRYCNIYERITKVFCDIVNAAQAANLIIRQWVLNRAQAFNMLAVMYLRSKKVIKHSWGFLNVHHSYRTRSSEVGDS